MKQIKQYIQESILDDEEDIMQNDDWIIYTWLKKYYNIQKTEYIIKNKTIILNNHNSYIYVYDKSLTQLLPEGFKFEDINGGFNCSECENLISLEGAPDRTYDFNCSKCTNLTSLKGAPSKVHGNFICTNCNKLIDLQYAPKFIYGDLNCAHCENLKKLNIKNSKIVGNLRCFDCKNLTSLEGCPIVITNIICSGCDNLTTLKDIPQNFSGKLYCDNNPKLKNLDLSSKKIKVLDCRHSGIELSPEEITKKFNIKKILI